MTEGGEPRDPGPVTARPASSTHGFLFADLRGYTAYIDRQGAVAASALLERFRTIVRGAVARHEGAEIRTEGDSFYVTFPSASLAVACALDIVTTVAAESQPDDPIRVGIGVHAGEAVETPEGPVGTAVNIAARLCALAGPGEVIVSDTVRSLTRSVGAAQFVPLGRKTVKGLDEPLTLYRAVPAGTSIPAPSRRPSRGRLVIVGAIATLVIVGAGVLLVLGGNTPPGTAGGPSANPTTDPSGPAASPSVRPSPSAGPSASTSSPTTSRRWVSSVFSRPFSIDTSVSRGWDAWDELPDRASFADKVTAGIVTVASTAAVLDPPCVGVDPAFLGQRPEDLMDWLESRTWLETSERRPFYAGRYLGQVIRVKVPTDARWACADGSAPATAHMFLMGGGETMGEAKGTEFWAAALDVGGRTVTVLVRPASGSFFDLDRILVGAEELLQTIEFAEGS